MPFLAPPGHKDPDLPNPSLLFSLQDVRYRQRYLDGIVNNENMRSIFTTRARIVQFVRRYLDQRDFLEVGP